MPGGSLHAGIPMHFRNLILSVSALGFLRIDLGLGFGL